VGTFHFRIPFVRTNPSSVKLPVGYPYILLAVTFEEPLFPMSSSSKIILLLLTNSFSAYELLWADPRSANQATSCSQILSSSRSLVFSPSCCISCVGGPPDCFLFTFGRLSIGPPAKLFSPPPPPSAFPRSGRILPHHPVAMVEPNSFAFGARNPPISLFPPSFFFFLSVATLFCFFFAVLSVFCTLS